jgi:hypothetical protein
LRQGRKVVRDIRKEEEEEEGQNPFANGLEDGGGWFLLYYAFGEEPLINLVFDHLPRHRDGFQLLNKASSVPDRRCQIGLVFWLSKRCDISSMKLLPVAKVPQRVKAVVMAFVKPERLSSAGKIIRYL